MEKTETQRQSQDMSVNNSTVCVNIPDTVESFDSTITGWIRSPKHHRLAHLWDTQEFTQQTNKWQKGPRQASKQYDRLLWSVLE